MALVLPRLDRETSSRGSLRSTTPCSRKLPRRTCQWSEQQHFACAIRDLQLYYYRLFDERSEHIVSESRSVMTEA